MQIKKEYSNGEITVVWNPRKCVHAGLCAGQLPSVFQPGETPWVKMDGASSQSIVEQVQRCPSGALSIKEMPVVDVRWCGDEKKGRFTLFENSEQAGEMTYTWADGHFFIIDHTMVDKAFAGKGYGAVLVKAGVDFAHDKGVKIVPLCPFAKREFGKHSEYEDVLSDG